MTVEEKAYNYASKLVKNHLTASEVAAHYGRGYIDGQEDMKCWHPANEPPTNEYSVNVKVVAQYPNGNYNEAWWRNGEWMFLSMDWEPVEILMWCYPPQNE